MSERSSLQELLDAPGAPLANWREIVKEIGSEFPTATTPYQREALLALYKSTMDMAEKFIDVEDLGTFRDARRKQYNGFLVLEALVGENVCVETLDAVTQREVAAGRMAPDAELRTHAEAAMLAPHLLHAELVAMEEERQRAEQASAPLATGTGWIGRVRRWMSRS